MLKSTGEVFKTVNMNFESRVTKLLKPNTKIRIQITEAGNSNEGMSNLLKKYTAYTIKLINLEDPINDILTRRRYSDFESLRDVLTKIFPLIVIPPIPPKNYFDFSMLNGLVGVIMKIHHFQLLVQMVIVVVVAVEVVVAEQVVEVAMDLLLPVLKLIHISIPLI